MKRTILLTGVVVLLCTGVGRAGHLLVTSNADDNQPGTLRYAIANAKSGDNISISPTLTTTPIVLTQGVLLIDKHLTIQAAATAPATISGNSVSGVFEIASCAQVTLAYLSIINGVSIAMNNNGTATVKNCTFSNNGSNSSLGAIGNAGDMVINNCTLSNNSANYGAAIVNGGTLLVKNSTLSDNHSLISAGGIFEHQ